MQIYLNIMCIVYFRYHKLYHYKLTLALYYTSLRVSLSLNEPQFNSLIIFFHSYYFLHFIDSESVITHSVHSAKTVVPLSCYPTWNDVRLTVYQLMMQFMAIAIFTKTFLQACITGISSLNILP